MSDEEARQLPVQPDATMLEAADISTWMTDAGAFDVLPGLVGADGRLVPYEELAQRETVIHGDGFTIRAAALADIITAKEHAGRPKDHAALPELRALRDGSATESSAPEPPQTPNSWTRAGSGPPRGSARSVTPP